MAYEKMVFAVADDPKAARLGGLPLLEDQALWPRDPETGEPLVLLASLPESYWRETNLGVRLPPDSCLSVFVRHSHGDRKIVRRMTVHEQSQLPKLAASPAKVVIHRTAESPVQNDGAPQPIVPMLAIELEHHPEDDRDPEMTDRGTTFSKIGGVPGWGQDEIEVPGHVYALQFEEYGIGRSCPDWIDVFGGGIGFLFLALKSQTVEFGVLFVQFT